MLLCHTHNHTHTHTCSLNYVFKAIRADYYRHVCLPFFKQSNWWNMIISVVLVILFIHCACTTDFFELPGFSDVFWASPMIFFFYLLQPRKSWQLLAWLSPPSTLEATHKVCMCVFTHVFEFYLSKYVLMKRWFLFLTAGNKRIAIFWAFFIIENAEIVAAQKVNSLPPTLMLT